MSTNLPTREPQVFTAGDTVQFQRVVSDYPATAFTLSYVLRGPTTIKFNAAQVPGTGDYFVGIAANTTANYKDGLYSVQAYASNATSRFSVPTFFPQVTILPDPSRYVDGTFDNRSFAQRTLDACETALLALSARQVTTASVNGQSYSIQNISALQALRMRMKEEVRSEQDVINYAAGLGVRKNILVRYPPVWASSAGPGSWSGQVPPIQ